MRAFLTLFLASPAPCCADVTPAINYYAGLDIIEVLTECRANISGAVTSALLPRLLPREAIGLRRVRQQKSPISDLLVKPVANLT